MYTQEQLVRLIAEVEKEFAPIIAKAEKPFAKPEDKSKDEAKASDESKGESKKPMESEKPADKGVEDQHQQDNSKEDKGQPLDSKEERVAADGKENSAPTEDPHGDAQDHGYDDEDLGHMHSMYSSMSRGELKAHHDAVRQAMDGHGLAKCEDGMAKAETSDAAKDAEGYRPNGGPKDGEAAKAKTPASSGAQALEKSEKDVAVEEVSLLKSELETIKAENEKSKKEVEAVAAFLTKFVEKTVPAGKAIMSLDVIAKTEGSSNEKPLSKGEIDAKLLAKSKDNATSQTDRNAINSYYFSKNVESVRHLLS